MEESIYLPEDINEQPVEVELTKPERKKYILLQKVKNN